MGRQILICLSISLLFLNFVDAAEKGLAAYWPMDGDAKDASGNGHDGIVQGAKFVDGVVAAEKKVGVLGPENLQPAVRVGANDARVGRGGRISFIRVQLERRRASGLDTNGAPADVDRRPLLF